MKPLAVEYRPLDTLLPYVRNARTHSKAQVRQIARSIEQFGFLVPVLVDKLNNIICGHGRVLAARQLGLATIPVLLAEHLTEAQVKAYRLADNQIALNAGWDEGLLRIELQELLKIDANVFDLGFSQGELNVLILDPETPPDIPIPPTPGAGETVTTVGDLWLLEGHRIACGDGRDPVVLKLLMHGQLARAVITDPPFNVPIHGHVGGLGKIQHAEFAMASGEMSSPAFTQFLEESVRAACGVSCDGAVHFYFMDWRHLPELHAACALNHLELLNLCVWSKTNAGMGSLYRSQHELILVVKHGGAPHINNVELGKHGRYRTNIWTYPGMNTFGAERQSTLALHPTVKPTALIRDAILDVTHFGDVVFDGFLGSGTTVLAAEQARRCCFGVEIEPRYVDVALQRWIVATGRQPIHAASGESYQARRERLFATA